MNEPAPLSDIWRTAVDANLRYYTLLGQLTARFFNLMLNAATELRPQFQSGSSPGRPQTAALSPPPSPSQAPVPSAMVLEGAVGGHALGVFLVQNGLPQRVSAPVVASVFVDSSGQEIHPSLKFEPAKVTLEPGEQVLVRVVAEIDEGMVPGVRYKGEISVPGLSGTRVPIVLRGQPGSLLTPPLRSKDSGTGVRPSTNRKSHGHPQEMPQRRSRKNRKA